MHPRVRPFLLVAGVGLLGGCALLPEDSVSVDELEQVGRAEAERDARAGYGHGTGPSAASAHEAARAELAQLLSSRVLARFRAETGQHPDDATLRLIGTSHLMARATLTDVQPDRRQRADDGWYVRLRLPPERMDLLRDEVNRQAPALFWFARVNNTAADQPGQRLKRALNGLAAAHAHDVADDPLYHNGRMLTFAAFFEQQLEASIEGLDVIPLVEGDRVRFLALDRTSLAPQPALALEIGGEEMVTDGDGRTHSRPLADLPRRLPLTLLGDSDTVADLAAMGVRPAVLREPFALDTREWGSAVTTQVLVHTRPAGALAELDEEASTTPGHFRRPNEALPLLRLTAPAGYRDRLMPLQLAPGAPFHYTSVPLMEQREGDVRLRADGHRTRLRLEGEGLLRETRGPVLNTRVPEGEYTVTVFHADGGDHQQVTDTITVVADTVTERHYRAPRERAAYYHGRRLALQLVSFAGDPGPDYRLPWGEEGHRNVEAIEDEYELEMDDFHLDLTLQGQALLDRFNTLLQGEVGLRSRQFTATDAEGESADWRLLGHHIAYGAGFWLPLGNSIATLSANQHHELVSWSGGNRPPDTGSQSASNAWRFTELSLITPVNVSLSVRVTEGTDPHYLIGFGIGRMQRGFEHPARVRARAGNHYTVP